MRISVGILLALVGSSASAQSLISPTAIIDVAPTNAITLQADQPILAWSVYGIESGVPVDVAFVPGDSMATTTINAGERLRVYMTADGSTWTSADLACQLFGGTDPIATGIHNVPGGHFRPAGYEVDFAGSTGANGSETPDENTYFEMYIVDLTADGAELDFYASGLSESFFIPYQFSGQLFPGHLCMVSMRAITEDMPYGWNNWNECWTTVFIVVE